LIKLEEIFERDTYCVGIICLFILPFVIPYLSYGFGRDHGFFSLAGNMVLKGEVPYRDIFEYNFPGTIYIHALIINFLGRSALVFRVTDLVYQSVFIGIFYYYIKFFLDRKTALLACLLYITLYFTLPYWDTCQRDGFVLPFLFLSSLFFFRGLDKPSLLLLAGFCDASAVFIKPVYGTLFLGQCLYLLIETLSSRHDDGISWKAFYTKGGMYAAGFTLPLLAYAAYLQFNNALMPFVDAFSFGTGCYAGAYRFHLYVVFEKFFLGSIKSFLAVCGVAVLLMRREKKHLFLLCTLVCISVPLFVQNKFFLYHEIPVRSVASILVALGTFVFVNEIDARKLLLFAVLFTACFNDTVMASGGYYAYFSRNTRIFSGEKFTSQNEYTNLLQLDEAVSFIKNNSSPDDTIYATGFDPILYYMSGREPASKYFTAFFFIEPCRSNIDLQQKLYKRFINDLKKKMPKILLVSFDSSYNTLVDNYAIIPQNDDRFAGWRVFLHDNYKAVKVIGCNKVYVRAE